MRFLTVLLISTLFSSFAFAMSSGGGRMERTRVGVFYGYGFMNPNDINNLETAAGGSPALSKLSSFFYYGAQLGYMVTPRVELFGEYNQEYAKNPTNTTLGTNAGVEEALNDFYVGLRYHLVDKGAIQFGLGGAVGYPTYAHASIIANGRKEYDATFSPIGKAMATFNFRISNRFSIFAEGGYEYCLLTGGLSNGAKLTNPSTGGNVNFDMSGIRAQAGVDFMF